VRSPKLYGWMEPRCTQNLGENAQGSVHVVWMNPVKGVGSYLILRAVTHDPFEC
jgi:hypothetical protein